MSRLENFTRMLGIKLVRRAQDSEGSYSRQSRTIQLDEDNSEVQDVAVLLHELGHAVDEMLIDDKIRKTINEAYALVYRTKVSKNQRNLVMNNEVRAWMYGRSIARQLKIRLGKWYSDQEFMCLRRYLDAA